MCQRCLRENYVDKLQFNITCVVSSAFLQYPHLEGLKIALAGAEIFARLPNYRLQNAS